MGLGREIKSAVIPIRTGSIAASSDSTRTALHTDAYLWPNTAVVTGKPLQRRLSRVVAHISPVSPTRRWLSVPLAAIHIGCQHHSPAMTTATGHDTFRIAVGPQCIWLPAALTRNRSSETM